MNRIMIRPVTLIAAAAIALGGATAHSGETGGGTGGAIARWVDADGVTHFGNPQFAPHDAEPVAVEPANGMAVPAAVPAASSGSRGPAVVVLEKKANRQTIGWRGHYWTVRQNADSRRRH